MPFSLIPKLILPSLTDLTPELLAARGVRFLMLDFDNTIVPYTTNEPAEAMTAWLRRMQASEIRLELKPKFILDEIGSAGGFFRKFYSFCITIVCPLVMALVTAGQFIDFFVGADDGPNAQLICYGVTAVLLVVFAIIAAVKSKQKASL